MKILHLENSSKPKGIEIRALLGAPEFEQLAGNLDHLCVFSVKQIAERASSIKTGAKHSYAKYLLLPVALRRKFKATDFDFSRLTCGAVEYKEMVFVIYGVTRKAVAATEREEDG